MPSLHVQNIIGLDQHSFWGQVTCCKPCWTPVPWPWFKIVASITLASHEGRYQALYPPTIAALQRLIAKHPQTGGLSNDPRGPSVLRDKPVWWPRYTGMKQSIPKYEVHLKTGENTSIWAPKMMWSETRVSGIVFNISGNGTTIQMAWSVCPTAIEHRNGRSAFYSSTHSIAGKVVGQMGIRRKEPVTFSGFWYLNIVIQGHAVLPTHSPFTYSRLMNHWYCYRWKWMTWVFVYLEALLTAAPSQLNGPVQRYPAWPVECCTRPKSSASGEQDVSIFKLFMKYHTSDRGIWGHHPRRNGRSVTV